MNLTGHFCVILTDVYTVYSLKNQDTHLNCKFPTLYIVNCGRVLLLHDVTNYKWNIGWASISRISPLLAATITINLFCRSCMRVLWNGKDIKLHCW